MKQMITHEQEKYGWEFIFLAANIDAVESAERYGIGRDRAVNYMADSVGTGVLYDAVNQAVEAVRCGSSLKEDFSWRKNADEDFQRRRK